MASSNDMGEGAELLGWLNGLVDGRYTSLASCADCVAYAQLLAAALPQCATRHLHYVVLDESEQRDNCAFLDSLLREVHISMRLLLLRSSCAQTLLACLSGGCASSVRSESPLSRFQR